MTCLGGTWSEPRVWYRFRDGAPVTGEPIEGRVCDPERMPGDRTRPRRCAGCPAYRGRLPGGGEQGIINPDDSLNSLGEDEYARYVELIEEEQDPAAFYQWLLEGGTRGWRAVDPERDNEYMRRWRAEHPGYDQRKRKRDRAAYMRSYRKRNPVTALSPRISDKVI